MKSSSSSASMVTHDLMTEILVRLPVKSLMRFKCVDPSWNTLFTTPSFITRNMQILHNERLMIFDDNEGPRRLMISTDNDEVLESPPFPLLDPNFFFRTEVCANSYNGVFCIKRYYRSHIARQIQLYLWNPTTREVKLLPLPPFFQSTSISSYNITPICALGGHPHTNDLKFLQIFMIQKQDTDKLIVDPFHIEGDEHSYGTGFVYGYRSFPPSVELYNLTTNSWTVLYNQEDTSVPPPFEYQRIIHFRDGAFVNGVYHWLTRQPYCMLSFDFRNNQFHKVELPPLEHNFDFSLVELNDSIAYVSGRMFPTRAIEIWILEQQDTCCWTKKFIFEQHDWGPLTVYNFWKDGPELLSPRYASCDDVHGRLPMYLASYNSDGHIVRHFEQVTFNDTVSHVHVLKYVESIAPLSFF